MRVLATVHKGRIKKGVHTNRKWTICNTYLHNPEKEWETTTSTGL
jgi:hypothetical protein